jgi:hypothetical protein
MQLPAISKGQIYECFFKPLKRGGGAIFVVKNKFKFSNENLINYYGIATVKRLAGYPAGYPAI